MRLKNLVVALTVAMVLTGYIKYVNIREGFSSNGDGKIDVFTQNEPFSGRGPNMPSDAFGPGNLVSLNAMVTYGNMPVQDLIVSFYVRSPDNQSFTLTSPTNTSGVAVIKFTIPETNTTESQIFGNWFASASAIIGNLLLQDTLIFKVDWIVKITFLRTIDENLTYRTHFGLNGYVGLEIALRNIAMRMKNASLAIVIQDELSVPVAYSEIRDFIVPPNEKVVFVYFKLHIPQWAFVGNATVSASALNSINGSLIPYCPTISVNFFIDASPPLAIAFHDSSVVNALPSANSVEKGQSVEVNVIVRNEGTEIESFDVEAYLNGTRIAVHVANLAPYLTATINFTFNTTMMSVGNHTVTSSIPFLPNEADLTDNFLADTVIEIKPKLPTTIHDIAIIQVAPSDNIVYIGQLLPVNVSIINKGSETESFDLKTYYGSTLMEILHVTALAPNTQTTLTSIWNTSLVEEGLYAISASAPLPDDSFEADNTFVNGVVQVKARPQPSAIHDVAVVNVTSSTNFAYVSDIINITVSVRNKGTVPESFNVTVFFNSTDMKTLTINDLNPGVAKKLSFSLDLQNAKAGRYVLSAYATPVPNELNIEDNLFRNGVVELSVAPESLVCALWPWWLVLFFLVLLIILSRRSRKRKATKKALDSSIAGLPACFKS